MNKIGIFWYYQNRIIGIAHTADISVQDSIGLIDSAYTHVEYWETLRKQINTLQYIEYEDIPRGRIIYDMTRQKTIAYMDTQLFKKSIAAKIADFFALELSDVVWKKDLHYKT